MYTEKDGIETELYDHSGMIEDLTKQLEQVRQARDDAENAKTLAQNNSSQWESKYQDLSQRYGRILEEIQAQKCQNAELRANTVQVAHARRQIESQLAQLLSENEMLTRETIRWKGNHEADTIRLSLLRETLELERKYWLEGECKHDRWSALPPVFPMQTTEATTTETPSTILPSPALTELTSQIERLSSATVDAVRALHPRAGIVNALQSTMTATTAAWERVGNLLISNEALENKCKVLEQTLSNLQKAAAADVEVIWRARQHFALQNL